MIQNHARHRWQRPLVSADTYKMMFQPPALLERDGSSESTRRGLAWRIHLEACGRM